MTVTANKEIRLSNIDCFGILKVHAQINKKNAFKFNQILQKIMVF